MTRSVRPALGTQRGLSLVELMVALVLSAVLASLAYPSFQSAILKARRSEALATLAQLQTAQERHRSNHASYATLVQLGMPPSIPGGRYRLSEEPPTASGFNVMATALGGQAADAACRHLRVQVDGVEARWASGPDADVGNTDDANRRCWGQ